MKPFFYFGKMKAADGRDDDHAKPRILSQVRNTAIHVTKGPIQTAYFYKLDKNKICSLYPAAVPSN